MTSADLAISRPRAGEWHISDGGQDVGAAHAMCRPNQRWYVSLDSWRDDAYQPLLAGGAALLDTLTAYLEQGSSLEATGRMLFVHTNTVRYRLKRVTELTGYTP